MNHSLGELLESFLNHISHPRGRTLAWLVKNQVTVDQAILLNHVRAAPDAQPSTLAEKMNLSLPSVSQMLERLVKLGFVTRTEHTEDRRRRRVAVTAKARHFLNQFRKVRASEFAVGTERLSARTKHRLTAALNAALRELEGAPS